MMRLYIWDTYMRVETVVSLLQNEDSTLNISPVTDDASESGWFETTSSKEDIVKACERAFKDFSIAIFYEKEKIFETYICEDCGSRDINVHKSRCVTQDKWVSCYCGYCHDDEI